MREYFLLLVAISCPLLGSGCGYSARSALPKGLNSVYVENFKNNITFTSETTRDLYFPLLETKIRKAVIDRYLFDGNLKIADPGKADLILKGDLVSYDRNAIRFTDNDDAEEYRMYIVMNLTLLDRRTNEPVWIENGFTGEATYFVSGPLVKSESDAIEDAMTDLARRIVERTIENW